MFLVGGLDAARNPESKVKPADEVVSRLNCLLKVDFDTHTAVRANCIGQLFAGTMLARGVCPRVAAAVLLGSLVPTTLACHRFWEKQGDDRKAQEIHFLKNLAMAGGLLLIIQGPA
jgi:putative oxidoreductase